jgi:hypothetical protein
MVAFILIDAIAAVLLVVWMIVEAVRGLSIGREHLAGCRMLPPDRWGQDNHRRIDMHAELITKINERLAALKVEQKLLERALAELVK